MWHGGCHVELLLGNPWFHSLEESNKFSFIATKLACKNDGGGGSQGCVQVASADSCRKRGIEADCSRLKPGARGEHLTSQLSWAAVWLLVTCGSPVYLVVNDELSHCVLWPLTIRLVGSAVFSTWWVVLLIGSWCYSREWVWNLRAKLLCCFREVKCKQGFTTGIWYYLYNALGLTVSMCISSLMVSKSNG